MPTFGSLFAGIGGIDLGLERAGFECRWQVEIDPFCRQVLAKHWPSVHRHDDVRTAGAACLEKVDVICGGFPCQDISHAGKREGIGGARSGLWKEYARIVGEIQPKAILIENVAALRGRGLNVVLTDLAALGYSAEWDCIPAAAVGAPHRRDRIFIIARMANPSSRRCGGESEGEVQQSRRAEVVSPSSLPNAIRDELRQQPGGQRGERGRCGFRSRRWRSAGCGQRPTQRAARVT